MPQLKECRVLILEDEILLAMDLEGIMREAGCADVEAVATVADALDRIETWHPDVVILDLNVSGEKSFPVADALDDASIPFVIVSGHSPDILPARHLARPFLGKPYEPRALLRTLGRMVDTCNP